MRPQTFCEAELQRVFPDDVDDASQTIAVLYTPPMSERFLLLGSSICKPTKEKLTARDTMPSGPGEAAMTDVRPAAGRPRPYRPGTGHRRGPSARARTRHTGQNRRSAVIISREPQGSGIAPNGWSRFNPTCSLTY